MKGLAGLAHLVNQVEVCMVRTVRDVCNLNSVGIPVLTRVIYRRRYPLPVESRVNDLSFISTMPTSRTGISNMQPPLRRHLSKLTLLFLVPSHAAWP